MSTPLDHSDPWRYACPDCKGRQISQPVGRDIWLCQACQQAGRDQHHEYVIDLKRDRRISAGDGETR
jgi:ribosomal protein L37AE/L43A